MIDNQQKQQYFLKGQLSSRSQQKNQKQQLLTEGNRQISNAAQQVLKHTIHLYSDIGQSISGPSRIDKLPTLNTNRSLNSQTMMNTSESTTQQISYLKNEQTLPQLLKRVGLDIKINMLKNQIDNTQADQDQKSVETTSINSSIRKTKNSAIQFFSASFWDQCAQTERQKTNKNFLKRKLQQKMKNQFAKPNHMKNKNNMYVSELWKEGMRLYLKQNQKMASKIIQIQDAQCTQQSNLDQFLIKQQQTTPKHDEDFINLLQAGDIQSSQKKQQSIQNILIQDVLHNPNEEAVQLNQSIEKKNINDSKTYSLPRCSKELCSSHQSFTHQQFNCNAKNNKKNDQILLKFGFQKKKKMEINSQSKDQEQKSSNNIQFNVQQSKKHLQEHNQEKKQKLDLIKKDCENILEESIAIQDNLNNVQKKIQNTLSFMYEKKF